MDEQVNKPVEPSAEERLREQRRASSAQLGDLAIQERRIMASLEELRARMIRLHDDVMALDKALTLVT